jgi:hypothetical protein
MEETHTIENAHSKRSRDPFVENEIFYHIQIVRPWKPSEWEIGQIHFIGAIKNPFVGFYDKNSFGVRDPNSGMFYTTDYIAAAMRNYIKTGRKEKDKNLSTFYHFDTEKTTEELIKVLNDYLLLVREWIFEEVRKEFFPNLPSRQRCLWVIPDDEKAIQYWWNEMGKEGKLLKLELTGKIHQTNQQCLAQTTQSLNEIRMKAFKYWAGASGIDSSQDEYLFEGFVKVLESITFESWKGKKS